MENDRVTLLRRLQICEFTLVECNLYLDTHPNDAEALKYYKKYLQMCKETKEEFVRKYGPITAADVTSDTTWTWICDPWPWEYKQEG
mgnify:FL=1